MVTRVTTNIDYRSKGEELSSVEVLFADGTYGYRSAGKITETRRHIDIQSVLDQIK